MIRKILVAVDSTSHALQVFDTAHLLGQRCQAQVFVFRAIYLKDRSPAAAANEEDKIPPLLIELERAKLVELAAEHPDVSVVPPKLTQLEPWHVILETARELNVDLIVIGRHAYHRWERLLGTTAARLVDHADRSVFVVHEQITSSSERS